MKCLLKSLWMLSFLATATLCQQIEVSPPQVVNGYNFSHLSVANPINIHLASANWNTDYKTVENSFPTVQKLQRQVHDKWFGRDKADHMAVSAGLVGFGYYIAREELNVSDWSARNSAAGFSLVIGVAKEIYDWKSRRGIPSYKDLIADFVGIGIGFLMITVGD